MNPATGAVFATAPRASAAQAEKAIAAARRAFEAWSVTPIAERQALVRELGDRVEANEERLARLLSEEQGEPLAEATAELQGAPAYFRYFAGLDLPGMGVESSDQALLEYTQVQVVTVAR